MIRMFLETFIILLKPFGAICDTDSVGSGWGKPTINAPKELLIAPPKSPFQSLALVTTMTLLILPRELLSTNLSVPTQEFNMIATINIENKFFIISF